MRPTDRCKLKVAKRLLPWRQETWLGDLAVMSPQQRDVAKPVNILKDLGSKTLGADSSLEEPNSGKLACDYDI